MGLLTRVLGPACLAALIAAAGCATSGARPEPAAAPLVVRDLGGRAHDLDAALRAGDSVALVFWQTWCHSCSREAPAIVAAARAHGERIRFVGVIPGRDDTVDDAEVRAVADSWGYASFPQVRDRDLALSRRFDVEGTPTIIVLGAGGVVRYRGHRAPEDWTASDAGGSGGERRVASR